MVKALEAIWSEGMLTEEASRSAHRYVETSYSVESFVYKLENAVKQMVKW
jgi:hypothetical protein